jgi:hypothetical protein
MSTTPTRLKPLKGEAARIYKLCQEKDLSTGLQGLALAAALGKPLEGLLVEVTVDGEGQLMRGKRFTGHDKVQPMLDALLLQQLALAEPGTPEAALRDSVRSIQCTVPVAPHLAPFTNLESAHLTLAPSFQLPDLAGLGTTAKLTSLTLDTGTTQYGQAVTRKAAATALPAPMRNLPFISAKGVLAAIHRAGTTVSVIVNRGIPALSRARSFRAWG